MKQWQCTSIVLTRLPFTFTSRRFVAGVAVAEPALAAAARRGSTAAASIISQLVNTIGAGAALAVVVACLACIICSLPLLSISSPHAPAEL
jgi:predicted aconitase with swiveling domain